MSKKWWDNLKRAHTDNQSKALLVRADELFDFLINAGGPFEISGIGGVGDPLLSEALEKAIAISSTPAFPKGETIDNTHSPIGAIDIDGAVLVAMEDPTDGLRSYCDYWVALPGAKLRTGLPRIPVSIQLTDASKSDGSREDRRDHPMIDMVSIHTKEILVSMGTEFGDAFYPCAIFRHYPKAMDAAAVESSHEQLDVSTPQAKRGHGGLRL